MAQDNVEVEIKTKLSKAKFESVKKTVAKTCKFVKEIHQVDDYHVPKYQNFLQPKYPYEWLSVRSRGGKVLLNYKCWYPKGAKNTKYCDEYETQVADKHQLEKIFKALDIKKVVSVDKTRLVYTHKNKFEIALDKVKGLGFFIEIEALKNEKNLDKTYDNLVEFAKLLGVKKIVMIPGGYAAEILRKKGSMKT